ncbi:hypothetical protein AOCH_005731 [Aspergillus ochraceoroseus]|uniref:Copper-fist domain-containing protein n=1 Tax=Aspergillus ochraceoroseus TaxID=138278 RepID=A0A0F8UWJ1_9EURO|nr:hypothetical protein AOCH_005731 [Aspergillus ochraceoroseus]
MPLDEEGNKWSCEPCIRGHRSSKCNHFDRLMMKVPKAGRPLAKCPHPKGNCACQKKYAFMVRVPKDSGCICRPVYEIPIEDDHTPAMTPVPATSPSKVQKSSKKYVKPSPETMTRALSAIPAFQHQPVPFNTADIHSYAPQAQMTACPHSAVGGNPNQQNAIPAINNIANGAALHSNDLLAGHDDLLNNFQPAMQPTVSTPMQAEDSCCRKSSSNGAQDGFKGESDTVSQNESSSSSPSSPTPSPFSALPMSHPSPSWQGFPSLDGHFCAASLHGTPNGHQSPVTQAVPQAYADGSPDSSQLSRAASISHVQSHMAHLSTAGPSNNTSDHSLPGHGCGTHRRCNCGPSCNCLGCPEHPYNTTTTQHVQQMGLLVAQDQQSLGSENNCCSTQVHGNHANEPELEHHSYSQLHHHMNNRFENFPVNTYYDPDFADGNHSHPSPPHEYIDPDDLMAPDQYYTYHFQVGLPGACAGEVGSCQCGPNCSCIGCLTHSGSHGFAFASGLGFGGALGHGEDAHSAVDDAATGAHTPVLDKTSHF